MAYTQPNAAAHLTNQAISLHQQGRIEQAEALYKSALDINPGDFDALHMLGIIHAQRGQFSEAEKLLHKAISVDKRVIPCWHNYGTILARLSRFEESIEAYRAAIALNPNYPPIYSDLGNSLLELQRFEEALTCYEKQLQFMPNHPDAWVGKGNVQLRLGDRDKASASFEKAIAINPQQANAWLGKGNVFFELRRHDEALAAYDGALARQSDLAEAWLGRGNVFAELKRYDEAAVAYDKAYSFKRDLMNVEGARLYAKMLCCDWSDLASDCDSLLQSLRAGKSNAAHFVFFCIPSSAEDQLRCSRLFAEMHRPKLAQTPTPRSTQKHEKIRVGYVSADFRQHATAYLIAGLFECHDRTKFEITGLSYGPADQSDLRKRLERSFDHFEDVAGLSDDQIASLIEHWQIDILVDLKGFTQFSRPGIFARRPAPIQVNYLGYPGTMGADYMDYIIADHTIIPAASENAYAEKIAFMPHSYQVNDRKREISPRVFTKAEVGLPETGFVFCCFNSNYKIVPEIFDCWVRILKAVDGSVLWLFEAHETAAKNLKKEAALRGIDPARLVFAPPLP